MQISRLRAILSETTSTNKAPQEVGLPRATLQGHVKQSKDLETMDKLKVLGRFNRVFSPKQEIGFKRKRMFLGAFVYL